MADKASSNVISSKGMSQAVRVGQTIFVAGQVAVDEGGVLIGAGDIVAQSRQCFANISRELKEHGAGLDDLVEVTAFVAHPFDLQAYVDVRTSLFSPDHPPATTTVVATLGSPLWLVEVKAIAALGTWS